MAELNATTKELKTKREEIDLEKKRLVDKTAEVDITKGLNIYKACSECAVTSDLRRKLTQTETELARIKIDLQTSQQECRQATKRLQDVQAKHCSEIKLIQSEAEKRLEMELASSQLRSEEGLSKRLQEAERRLDEAVRLSKQQADKEAQQASVPDVLNKIVE
ncbi:unnamed protein product [Protopolystoma xenopodis]|uniref:Uncharacterized protein n=1 Tax=Protopolystoma xenopodis TaxID=117903 RepID=A0A448WGI4_9PLAT|nr:unnamed protein product [Protopolystoma xenopodis]